MTSNAPAAIFRQKALHSLSSLPPLSPILNRLLASLAKDDISFAQLGALIEKDTVLAGNVLKTVNSALYGCSGTINSVNHAIAIMGLSKLRNTALSFSVNRMWKSIKTPRGWSTARFNLHSVATALMADKIAECVPVEYAEGAFVGGLFHDIGKLLIAIALVDEYEKITRLIEALPAGDSRTPEDCEREFLGLDHCELSAAALESWKLPYPVQLAVRHHHQPKAAPKEPGAGSPFHLADIIHAADATVKALDITIEPPRKGYTAPEDYPALAGLGLADKASKLVAAFLPEFEAIRSFSS
ncbi:MAG: HDOD domain-containing protein [Bryobacteraceae bacterium]